MTTRRWSFRGDRELHVVELVHGFVTGKRKLTVDGRVLVEETTFLDGGSHHAFDVDGRACAVAITCPTGITYRYALLVDGAEVPPDAAARAALPAVGGGQGGTVPIPASPPVAAPRDVAVRSRFVDFTRWFKGER